MTDRRAKRATLPKPKHHDPDTFVLPHNLEAERATLGAALVTTAAADYIVDALKPEAYFRRAHQVLFAAIRELRDRKSTVDFVTLKDLLVSHKQLDDVGGPTYIAGLSDGLPRSTNVEHYAAILKDLHIKRALVGASQHTIDLVAEASHPAEAIVQDADRRLMELQAGHTESRMRSLRDTLHELNADLEWRVNHRGELTGVDTGYQSINEMTLGWQAGDLIIVAARPSIGKTTFVVNSAVLGAGKCNRDGNPYRIAVFSLEMRRQQLEYRILSQLSGVPLSRILGGHLGDPDFARIAQATCAMNELRIEIDDRASQTVWDIRSACRRLKADGGLDAVVIDYIQLMTGTIDRRGASRNDEITDISRRLKVLADEVAVPVIALSQLTRENEKRADPRPKLSDLRESGSLEQDADIVAFLHRKNHREGGTTQFIFEKQRNGPTGTVNLTLDRDVVTFADGGEDPPAAAEKPEKVTRRPELFRRGRSS